MLRFVGKVENVITKQVTQKMPETDSWFEDRAASVENLQVFYFCPIPFDHFVSGATEATFNGVWQPVGPQTRARPLFRQPRSSK